MTLDIKPDDIYWCTVDDHGHAQSSGYLVITSPWPSMLRGIYKDPIRYKETYWKKWDGGYYFTGDGAKQDEDGYFWLSGRIDDVINVSGHRLGTMEIESALIDYRSVAEAAVVLKEGVNFHADLENDLKQHVVKKIGAIARPERIPFIGDLPKTRSGKIMRRLLRDIAEGRIAGDTTTLSDSSVIEELKEKY